MSGRPPAERHAQSRATPYVTGGPTSRAARFTTRIGWGLADQGLSSLTNFVLGVAVARTVGLTEFGAFGLVFAGYQIVTALSRAVTAQPLLIRYSGVATADWRRGVAAGTGIALLIGVAASVGSVAIAMATDGSLRSAFLALALVFPGLVVQDAWRFGFFAHGRGRSAFVNDAIWTTFQFTALLIAFGNGAGTVFWAVVAWGGAATVAAVAGVIQARVIPRPQSARAWSREHRDLLPPYIGEVAAYILSGQVMLYAVGIVAGLGVVGALRAAATLLGPLNVVVQGFYLVAVPEAVKVLRTSAGRLGRLCLVAGIALAAAAVVWTLILVLLPESLGHALLGSVWDPAREILLSWGLAFAAINLGTGASIGLRALAAARRSLTAAVITSILGFLGAVVGAEVGGAAGSGWGFLIAQTVGIGVWWWEFRRGLRDYVASGKAPPVDIPSSPLAVPAAAAWPNPERPEGR